MSTWRTRPLGLYAVVPPHTEHTSIQPGTIYCLKQRVPSIGSEAVNPLQPYFLVYVRETGEVRYNFTAPKQVAGNLPRPLPGQD